MSQKSKSRIHPAQLPVAQALPSRWFRSAWPLGLLSAGLCYLAQPPVALGVLAWGALVPCLLLARLEKLPGRRPYRTLWACGALGWLATLQWLRLAHPSNHLALLLLASYLGLYVPIFVGLTRVARRKGMPLWGGAAIVWTGLELIRAHLATGFMMGSLAHTQVKFPAVLQIADVAGEYGVTFVILLVNGCLAEFIARRVHQESHKGPAARPFAPAAFALLIVLAWYMWNSPYYGSSIPHRGQQQQTVALIQGNIEANWKADAGKRARVMHEHYKLTAQAVELGLENSRPVDLVVWPETMYRDSLLSVAEGFTLPKDVLGGLSEKQVLAQTPESLRELALESGAGLLLGIDRRRVLPPSKRQTDAGLSYDLNSYNSVVMVNRAGELQGTYDKWHRVPYGEYTPFESWFPYPDGFTPLTGGIVAGERAKSFEFEGVRYSPSVCYEKAVPHLMRRQMAEMAARDERPDVLVNVTNDAWYRGSAELDMHLACGVLRAVELRTPMLISGNRGLSAHIDAAGKLLQVSERNQPAVLLAQVAAFNADRSYPSIYARWGDWLPTLCLVCCVVFAAVGFLDRRKNQPSSN